MERFSYPIIHCLTMFFIEEHFQGQKQSILFIEKSMNIPQLDRYRGSYSWSNMPTTTAASLMTYASIHFFEINDDFILCISCAYRENVFLIRK
jgi:hypothetical protein